MATLTYVRTGSIQWPMSTAEQALYAEVSANALGTTFQADLAAPTKAWLIGNGVIAPAPDVAVTLPVDGVAAGDLPTADGSGDYAWAPPA